MNIAKLAKIESKPAPTASDFENTERRPQNQLRGQMALFGQLRIVERLLREFKVCAAILTIGI